MDDPKQPMEVNPDGGDGAPGLPLGLIVGAAVGGLALLAAVVGVAVWMRRQATEGGEADPDDVSDRGSIFRAERASRLPSPGSRMSWASFKHVSGPWNQRSSGRSRSPTNAPAMRNRPGIQTRTTDFIAKSWENVDQR